MTKLLVNLTRKIVYYGQKILVIYIYIYSGIIIPVHVRGKYSTCSFKIYRWKQKQVKT